MATTFSGATDATMDMLTRVMREHHPKLAEAGVRVDVLMAENPTGDAVKHRGAPAIAVVRVVRLKDRVKGMGDAEITIDLSAWDGMTDRHREAVLFHELEHLVRVDRKNPEEGEPAWATDDIGRPKLRLRPGDVNLGDAFIESARLFGDFAAEYQNIRRAWVLMEGARREHDEAGDAHEPEGDSLPLSELEEAA